MFAATAFLGLLSLWQTPDVACVARGGEFHYPPLARAARVYGEVVVGVVIGENGAPAIETIQGHPLLSRGVDDQMSSVTFPPSCAGQEIDLRLVYRLIDSSEGRGSRASGPNEWLIQAAPLLISDPPATLGRRPWWKRIFRRG